MEDLILVKELYLAEYPHYKGEGMLDLSKMKYCVYSERNFAGEDYGSDKTVTLFTIECFMIEKEHIALLFRNEEERAAFYAKIKGAINLRKV
jgi:hypothetical protein